MTSADGWGTNSPSVQSIRWTKERPFRRRPYLQIGVLFPQTGVFRTCRAVIPDSAVCHTGTENKPTAVEHVHMFHQQINKSIHLSPFRPVDRDTSPLENPAKGTVPGETLHYCTYQDPRYLAFQRHACSVELVDLPLVHLLSLEGEKCASLILGLTLGLGIEQLRLDLLLDVVFPDVCDRCDGCDGCVVCRVKRGTAAATDTTAPLA